MDPVLPRGSVRVTLIGVDYCAIKVSCEVILHLNIPLI